MADSNQEINITELNSLKVMCFFYMQIKQIDSAMRAVKAILAISPKDEWAIAMFIRLSDIHGDYQKVYELTADTSYVNDENLKNGLLLLRARAMQKLGKKEELAQILEQVNA